MPDRLLHQSTVVSVQGEGYRLKSRTSASPACFIFRPAASRRDRPIPSEWTVSGSLEPNWICSNNAVLQWHRTATTQAGEVQDWIGCDLLTFEGPPRQAQGHYFKIRTRATVAFTARSPRPPRADVP